MHRPQQNNSNTEAGIPEILSRNRWLRTLDDRATCRDESGVRTWNGLPKPNNSSVILSTSKWCGKRQSVRQRSSTMLMVQATDKCPTFYGIPEKLFCVRNYHLNAYCWRWNSFALFLNNNPDIDIVIWVVFGFRKISCEAKSQRNTTSFLTCT